MKTVMMSVFFLSFLPACDTLEKYEELSRGETAVVYACGEWRPEQLLQIQGAVEDWDSGNTLASGQEPFAYGGWRPEMASYGEDQIHDGVHCVYQLIDDTKYAHRSNLTSYGRELWQEYRVDADPKAAALYDNDDIVVFNEDPDLLNPDLPPHSRWMMQFVVTHELGHAGGLGHQPAGTDSIMTPKAVVARATALDHLDFQAENGGSL